MCLHQESYLQGRHAPREWTSIPVVSIKRCRVFVAEKETTRAHIQHTRLTADKRESRGLAHIDNAATKNADCGSLVSYLSTCRSETANLTDVAKNVQQNK